MDPGFVWNPNGEADLGGYRIYAGRQSGNYAAAGSPKDVGRVTAASFHIDDNESGVWYFALTAYNTSGQESPPSVEISDDFSRIGRGSAVVVTFR